MFWGPLLRGCYHVENVNYFTLPAQLIHAFEVCVHFIQFVFSQVKSKVFERDHVIFVVRHGFVDIANQIRHRFEHEVTNVVNKIPAKTSSDSFVINVRYMHNSFTVLLIYVMDNYPFWWHRQVCKCNGQATIEIAHSTRFTLLLLVRHHNLEVCFPIARSWHVTQYAVTQAVFKLVYPFYCRLFSSNMELIPDCDQNDFVNAEGQFRNTGNCHLDLPIKFAVPPRYQSRKRMAYAEYTCNVSRYGQNSPGAVREVFDKFSILNMAFVAPLLRIVILVAKIID